MYRYISILVASILGFVCLTGCSTMRSGGGLSAAERQGWLRTELFFERAGDESVVTVDQWDGFLSDYVRPRFEDDWWVIDATGQRMKEHGPEVATSKILILIHEDTPAANQSVDHIRAAYQRLYGGAVLRASVPAHVSTQPRVRAPQTTLMGTLENEAINESSGLAYGLGEARVLWTHNDSGDIARFFALGLRGEAHGEFIVEGAPAVDWEDMCAFRRNGQRYLLFADVGDNLRRRDTYQLYIVREPALADDPAVIPEQTVNFVYEDGPHNCESVAVDAEEGVIYLVSKNWGWNCNMYMLPLAAEESTETVVARRVGEIGLPRTTAMDLSPDGQRLVILTYGDAYEFAREPGEGWQKALERDPRVIPMPKRKQGESICYSPDGLRLYLTSEKLPAPLWEVMLSDE